MMIPLGAVDPVLLYLDPGTGSIILQAIAGIVLGSIYAGRMFWARVRTAVSGIFGKKAQDETEHSG